MKTPQSILKDTFGFEAFRPNQLQVIESILARRDTLAVMPTGGGKSLCYQLSALLREGTAVVVSPLISLMQDQVRLLDSLGIPAGCLHSGQELDQKRDVFSRIRGGNSFVLYLSPERVQKEGH